MPLGKVYFPKIISSEKWLSKINDSIGNVLYPIDLEWGLYDQSFGDYSFEVYNQSEDLQSLYFNYANCGGNTCHENIFTINCDLEIKNLLSFSDM